MLQDPYSKKFRRNVFLIGTTVSILLAVAVFTWVPPAPPPLNASAPTQGPLVADRRGEAPVDSPAPSSEGEGSRPTRPGQVTYGTYCAQCHGPTGEGGTRLGDMMPVRPTHLVKGPFRYQRTPEALMSIIKNGIGYMPGFGRELSDQEALLLAEYTASLEQRGGTP